MTEHINEKGELHRTDGPAVEHVDGFQAWYLNNKLHRVDGPAVVYGNGSREWWLDGKRHRTDGPAFEYKDGYREWWVNGEFIKSEQSGEKVMDYDRSIHNNPDAQAWAKFFIETTKDMGREVFSDEGYMITWFSNAMMAMHDSMKPQETDDTINRLMLEKKKMIELVDYFVKENNRLKQVLQQIAEEGSGHGQALAYAALKEDE